MTSFKAAMNCLPLLITARPSEAATTSGGAPLANWQAELLSRYTGKLANWQTGKLTHG
jgi:hypothetical protein